MDLESVILSEVSLTEKKDCMTSLICGIKKEMIQMNLLTKQKETHKLQEQVYGFWGKAWGEAIVRGCGMGMYTLLHLKWITNKDLLYSTGNSAQCYVAAWMGGRFGVNGYMHVYG